MVVYFTKSRKFTLVIHIFVVHITDEDGFAELQITLSLNSAKNIDNLVG
jgi:hypothetical protein